MGHSRPSVLPLFLLHPTCYILSSGSGHEATDKARNQEEFREEGPISTRASHQCSTPLFQPSFGTPRTSTARTTRASSRRRYLHENSRRHRESSKREEARTEEVETQPKDPRSGGPKNVGDLRSIAGSSPFLTNSSITAQKTERGAGATNLVRGAPAFREQYRRVRLAKDICPSPERWFLLRVSGVPGRFR